MIADISTFQDYALYLDATLPAQSRIILKNDRDVVQTLAQKDTPGVPFGQLLMPWKPEKGAWVRKTPFTSTISIKDKAWSVGSVWSRDVFLCASQRKGNRTRFDSEVWSPFHGNIVVEPCSIESLLCGSTLLFSLYLLVEVSILYT